MSDAISRAAPDGEGDDPRKDAILSAAAAVFSRYGFKRASMEDIAREAGVSRPALYLRFANKAAIHAALAHAVAQRAIDGARAAWPPGAPLAEGLAAAALAQHGEAHALVRASPHGGELLAADTGLIAAIVADLDARFEALLIERLGEAGVPDAQALAPVLAAALHGLKTAADDAATLEAGFRRFAALVAAGV
jgi:AcrR family transcriptional regulator